MRRIRFTISSLLATVLLFGVGFAALRESNEIWDSGLFSVTLAALLISILLAIHRNDATRAFWLGFALLGLSYLVLSLIPSIESRLVTTKALAYLDTKVPGRTQTFFKVQFTATGSGAPGNQVQAVAFSPQGDQIATSSLGTVKLWDATTGRLLGGWAGTTENFVRIGHSMLALLVGWFGGLLSVVYGELPDHWSRKRWGFLDSEGTYAHDRRQSESFSKPRFQLPVSVA